MAKAQLPEKLRPFAFHGVSLDVAPGDKPTETVTATCPFCDKSGHMYINTRTGQWSCKRCGEGQGKGKGGNIPGFITKIHAYSLQATTDGEYAELSSDRCVPEWVLREWGVARSILTGEWLLPAYNTDGKLANVSRWAWVRSKKKFLLMGTPGCLQHPFGTQLLNKHQDHRHVSEGPWDGMALYGLLATHRQDGSKYRRTRQHADRCLLQKHGVFAVPGAGTFKTEWLEYLGDRSFLWYDNDHPHKRPNGELHQSGSDGMEHVRELWEQYESPCSILHRVAWDLHDPDREPQSTPKGWSKELPDGYDVRDLVRDASSSTAALTKLFALPQRIDAAAADTSSPKSTRKGRTKEEGDDDATLVEPIHRDTFSALCADYADTLHFTQQMRDTLAAMLSVVISTTLEGDQLWLRVIGPPGSGKTTLAEAISPARKYIFPRSIVTGFHSGYIGDQVGRRKAGKRAKKKGDDESADLIQRMNGKTVVIKDGDTLISSPSRDRTLSELRDIYDGTSRAEYRNKQSYSYEDLHITFILCATDSIRTLNRSFLGDRFLDCEILGDEDTRPYLDRALGNTYNRVIGSLQPVQRKEPDSDGDHEVHGRAKSNHLAAVTVGYLYHLKQQLMDGTLTAPEFPASVGRRIKLLGQFVSYMRARVQRDGTDGMAMRPRVELATRLVSQLTKLAVCQALVTNKARVDGDVLRVVRKISLDTAVGFHLEITDLLKEHGQLSVNQISLQLNLPETSVRRCVGDMQQLGILQKGERSNNSGVRGRKVHLWELTDHISELYDGAMLD